jgi:hypothetical protein
LAQTMGKATGGKLVTICNILKSLKVWFFKTTNLYLNNPEQQPLEIQIFNGSRFQKYGFPLRKDSLDTIE